MLFTEDLAATDALPLEIISRFEPFSHMCLRLGLALFNERIRKWSALLNGLNKALDSDIVLELTNFLKYLLL